jgi:predicted permease
MFFGNLLQDFRYTLRQLRKSPGFTLTAVLTLAFGIGATTAIFSIVEGVLLRPLPFVEPERLVVLGDIADGADANGAPTVSASQVNTYSRDTRAFANLGGYEQTSFGLSGVDEPAQINASRLTAGIFPTLGVSPLMGRAFTRQEDESSQQVVVISYPMWHSRMHDDHHAIGQKILLDRKPYEIVGVMPRDFEFPLVPGQLNRSELWVPMSFSSGELTEVGSFGFNMVGRLKPGISAEQARQDAQRVAQQIMLTLPPALASIRLHAVVQSLGATTVASAKRLIWILFLAVVVVLLMACANLAGLLLVRVIRSRREISVRLALGASGAAVLRRSLVEALMLSVVGGLAGLAFALSLLRAGVRFLPESLPRINAIGLDWKVVFFTIGIALLTGLLCGLLPAYAASRTSVNYALKEGGRTGSTGSDHTRLRSILVVAELAIALVLLTASGLLLRSFEKMREVDMGFHTDHTLTASYSLPQQQYSTQAAVNAFSDTVIARLEQIPGVQAAGITLLLPASGQNFTNAFYAEGYVAPKGAPMSLAWNPQVSGHYFAASGIPILRGREFTSADTASSPLVVIVNRMLAEHYWPGQDPIGKRIHIGFKETALPWMTVVGEIGNIKQGSPDAGTVEQLYQPVTQYGAALGSFLSADTLIGNAGSLVIRSSQPPEQLVNSLRAVVRSIDPQLPLTQVESMDSVVSDGQASRRFNTVIISSFAAAAVFLSLLGIYSVIAFSIALRTKEMAIRLALGSQRASVMRLVLISGAKLGLTGCGIGAIGAVFATRLLRSMLFQVDPLDPFVLVLAAISIFLLALVASVVPARRAASVEPMQALRAE